MAQQQASGTTRKIERWFEGEVVQPMADFADPKLWWRRHVLGAPRHVLPGPRRGRWRDDGSSVPGDDQPDRGGRRPWPDGDGDHPVHGEGLRRAPQPRRQYRVRPPQGLPVAPGTRVHRRAARGRSLGRVVPAVGDPRVRDVRIELPRVRLLVDGRVPDGGRPDARSRQRHPGHRIGGPEPRRARRARRRCVHRSRRSVGEPDLRRVDEPRAHVRAEPGRRETSRTTGCTSPARWSVPCSRSARRSCCEVQGVALPGRERPKAPSPRRSRAPTRRSRTHSGAKVEKDPRNWSEVRHARTIRWTPQRRRS